MDWFVRFSVLSVLAVSVVGCTEAPPEVQDIARLRVVNASTDSPPIDGCFDGGGSIFESVGGAIKGTGYVEVEAGAHTLDFVAENAECTTMPIIDDSVLLTVDTDSTFLLLNVFDQIESVLLADDNSPPEAGMVRLRFVHAHPDGPQVDIHFADGALLVDDMEFKDVSEYVATDAGAFVLQVRSSAGDAILRTFAAITVEDGQVITFYFLNMDDLDVNQAVFFTRDVE